MQDSKMKRNPGMSSHKRISTTLSETGGSHTLSQDYLVTLLLKMVGDTLQCGPYQKLEDPTHSLGTIFLVVATLFLKIVGNTLQCGPYQKLEDPTHSLRTIFLVVATLLLKMVGDTLQCGAYQKLEDPTHSLGTILLLVTILFLKKGNRNNCEYCIPSVGTKGYKYNQYITDQGYIWSLVLRLFHSSMVFTCVP